MMLLSMVASNPFFVLAVCLVSLNQTSHILFLTHENILLVSVTHTNINAVLMVLLNLKLVLSPTIHYYFGSIQKVLRKSIQSLKFTYPVLGEESGLIYCLLTILLAS